MATLTIIGLEEYANSLKYSLFDKMVLPVNINKQILTDAIQLACGEFEVIYTDPDFMRDAIGVWSRKMYPTFSKWADALDLAKDFNPLENYDRKEEWTINNTGTQTNASTSTTDGSSSDHSVSSGADEFKKSAYNSDTMRDDTINNTSGDTLNTHNDETNIHAQNTMSNDLKEVRSIRAHGNIGVTTLSQLLGEYFSTIGTCNIYSQICDLFVQEFTIMVY